MESMRSSNSLPATIESQPTLRLIGHHLPALDTYTAPAEVVLSFEWIAHYQASRREHEDRRSHRKEVGSPPT